MNHENRSLSVGIEHGRLCRRVSVMGIVWGCVVADSSLGENCGELGSWPDYGFGRVVAIRRLRLSLWISRDTGIGLGFGSAAGGTGRERSYHYRRGVFGPSPSEGFDHHGASDLGLGY